MFSNFDKASYAAGDAEQIMNSVDVLLASPDVDWDGQSPTASLLTALEAQAFFPFERDPL